MKKFFAVILTLAILAGGYMILNGKIQLPESSGKKAANLISVSGKAETKTREETAQAGAERLDRIIWAGIRGGGTEETVSMLSGMGYDAEWVISTLRNSATAMNKRHVHILAEIGDVCVAEAVHYLVTKTNNGKDFSESNSHYWLYLRKADGRWEPATFSDEETEALDAQMKQAFRPEAIEAAEAGRNAANFGNWMWTRNDGVEEGVYIAETAYMYQEENGDVVAVIKLANGEKVIRKVTSVSLTVTDEKLGQVLKATDSCSVSVLPGTVELYEMRIPASKVKKGTWTTMNAHVHTEY